LRNHYCSEKTVSVNYFECVSVSVVIQHGMRMRHIFICGLSDTTVYFHCLMNGTIFGEKKVVEDKTFVLNFSTTFSEEFN